MIEEFGGGAMPHEGKLYFQNPWNRVPTDKQKAFMDLKSELDPNQLFFNQYMRRYFAGDSDLSSNTETHFKD